jgi:CO/xanthine dehydrogenase FAD-binding subunit
VKEFDYRAPRTLAEALADYSAHPTAKLLAGGTDLIVQMRAGRKTPDLVLDIKHIPELREISFDAAKGLTLGAAVPCHLIYENEMVTREYPALAELAGIIGGTAIQGRASIGGNVCNSSPSADSIPLLIAMGTECRIASATGERTVPVESFCLSPGRNVLEPGELLVSLRIPAKGKGTGSHYLRFIPRNEMDIAVVGAGVEVTLSDGKISAARVALAAVAPVPLYVAAAGAALIGKAPDAEAFEAAAQAARDAATPIQDMRGTVAYRKHLCGVLTRRALETAVARAKEKQ